MSYQVIDEYRGTDHEQEIQRQLDIHINDTALLLAEVTADSQKKWLEELTVLLDLWTAPGGSDNG